VILGKVQKLINPFLSIDFFYQGEKSEIGLEKIQFVKLV